MVAFDNSIQQILPYIFGQKVDNTSVQSSVITVNSVCLSLVVLTAGLRLWVRYGMLRSGGLDDLLIIIALLFACLLSISAFIGEVFGFGKHIWNLSPGDLANILPAVARITKSLYGAYLAYSTAITFTKFSIMATYFRIFPPGALRKIVVVCGTLVMGFWITSIFAIIFTCVPVRAAWDYSVEGHCYPIVHFFYASSSFNIFTDILLCVLPIPSLWALSMPKSQRVLLCALFCGGAFACVASILRLTHLNELNDGVDVTYDAVSSLNWSIVEVDTGIICASVSALRPFARRLFPSFLPHTVIEQQAYGLAKLSPPSRHTEVPASTQMSKAAKNSLTSFASPENAYFPERSNSKRSAKGEIYVLRTFDVQTNKDPTPASSTRVPVSAVNPTKTPYMAEKEYTSETSILSKSRQNPVDKHNTIEKESSASAEDISPSRSRSSFTSTSSLRDRRNSLASMTPLSHPR